LRAPLLSLLSFFLFIFHTSHSRWHSESSTVFLYVSFYLCCIDSLSNIISQDNGRTISVLVAAKHNDLDLELVNTQANSSAEFNSSAEYLKVNPTGKIPAFEGANGFTLSEVIAIAVYGT
jgi:hypothetical protein